MPQLREGSNGLSSFDRLQTLTSQRRVGQRWHPGKRTVPGLAAPQHARAVAAAAVAFPGPLADPKGPYTGPQYRKANRGKRTREQRRVKTGAELARLEIASVKAAMTDWSYSSEVSMTRSGNVVYRRPHSIGPASSTPTGRIGPAPRMLTSMSVPSLQLKDQLVHLVDYDMIAAELRMPRSLVEATAVSLESRAPFENYEDDERAVTGHVLDSSNRPMEPELGTNQLALGGFPGAPVDRWEPELARRHAERAAEQHAAEERWRAAAGPGSMHRAEVDTFRKTKLGLSGKLHGWEEQFKKEARWIASRKVMEKSVADDPEKRWARIDEENAPRLPAWYHSAEQLSFRESQQMQLNDAAASADQAKLEADANRRARLEEAQRISGVDDRAPGESATDASAQSTADAREQSSGHEIATAPATRSEGYTHPTVDVSGEWDAGMPTPEIAIAQKTRVMQQIAPQEEHYLELEEANPLAKQLGVDRVDGAVSVHGAALPKFAGHHPADRVDDMRDRIHVLFKHVDTDSNGAVTKEELHHTLKEEGEVQKELVQLIHKSGRDLHSIFEQLDTDGDHKITTSEFLGLIEGTAAHPMAGAVDWEHMDPMTAKPVVQKPTLVAPLPMVLRGPSAQTVFKSVDGEDFHMAAKSSRRKKKLGLQQIQTDAKVESEPKDLTDTTGSVLDESESKMSGTEATNAEKPLAEPVAKDPPEDKSTQQTPHRMQQQEEDIRDADATVAAVAELYAQQVISQGIADAKDPPEDKSSQQTPHRMQQQEEDKRDADATVAAVAELYAQQVISQGIADALLSWPEEFTEASHPEQWSVFSVMDADGNGTLDSEELFFALVSVVAPAGSVAYSRTAEDSPSMLIHCA
eukprot:COSAG02_NODE_260_length_26771_cov_3110.350817_13_plen_864_part_00